MLKVDSLEGEPEFVSEVSDEELIEKSPFETVMETFRVRVPVVVCSEDRESVSTIVREVPIVTVSELERVFSRDRVNEDERVVVASVVGVFVDD